MPRIYIEQNNTKYYDWELASLSTRIPLSDKFVYLEYGVTRLISLKIIDMKNDDYIPPQGSDINIIPACSESLDNIRKCYNVKKGYDTGVCNIFSNCWPGTRSREHVELAICPSVKKVCVYHYDYNKSHDEFMNILSNIYAANNISKGDMLSEILVSRTHIYAYKKIEAWEALLKGTLKKPAVYISNLDLNTGDELTPDVLSLVHITGSVQANEPDAEKNFVLQLNVLNNYNWREYPYTMYLLFRNILLGIKGCIERMMYYHPSYFKQSYNKIVKQFIRELKLPSEKITQKDFDMAQGMLKKVLKIDDTIFVSPVSLLKKLDSTGIRLEIFEKYFNSIVKISPKTNNCG